MWSGVEKYSGTTTYSLSSQQSTRIHSTLTHLPTRYLRLFTQLRTLTKLFVQNKLKERFTNFIFSPSATQKKVLLPFVCVYECSPLFLFERTGTGWPCRQRSLLLWSKQMILFMLERCLNFWVSISEKNSSLNTAATLPIDPPLGHEWSPTSAAFHWSVV